MSGITIRDSRTFCVCVCDCGRQHTAQLKKLRSGHTKSCGCFHRTSAAARKFKHGKTYSKEYRAWSNMKSRCLSPKNQDYHLYGGRGISVDPEWAADFAAFLRDMGKCPPVCSLDRIDVSGNYEPGNCRWANPIIQANNRRPRSVCRNGHQFTPETTKIIKANGGTCRACLICINQKKGLLLCRVR